MPAAPDHTDRLAVLVSGTGTILEAIIASGLPVELVLADRQCRGLDIARAANVDAILVDRRDFGYVPGADWNRADFTEAICQILSERQVDLVAMAGFMTVLSPAIFDRFKNRILNTHPSLLPKHKGAHAVPSALASGDAETGCTVHVVIPELDSGRILAQSRVPILATDTAESLQERIKVVERKLYPSTIRAYFPTIHP